MALNESGLKDLQIFSKEFHLMEALAEGAFGKVWSAIHHPTGNTVAIKFEKARNTLKHEYSIYELIRFRDSTLFSVKPIPGIHGFGKITLTTWLAMDLLGPSIDELFIRNGQKFTINTICMLAIEMMKCLEFLHDCKIIHCDVKGENFAISATDPRKIVIFDFGLARQQASTSNGFRGTLYYASIAAHEIRPPHRKDDIESLAYILADYHKELPWKKKVWPTSFKKCVECGPKWKKKKNIFAMTPAFFELTLLLMHIGSQDEPDCTYLKQMFRYFLRKSYGNIFNLTLFDIFSRTKLDETAEHKFDWEQ